MRNQHADSTGAGRTAGRGSVEGDGTHACPPGFPVKGNASSKLAHLPGGRWYDATIPEICFATPEDAEDDGYRVTGNASERTWVRGDGSHACPEGFPIKGNLSSMIAHPPESRYFDATIPEICFATAEAAVAHGYRISAGPSATHSTEAHAAADGGKTAADQAAVGSTQLAGDRTEVDRASNQTIPTSAVTAKDDAPPSAVPSSGALDTPDVEAPVTDASLSSTVGETSASLRSTSEGLSDDDQAVAPPAPSIAPTPPTVAPAAARANLIESSQTQSTPPGLNQPPHAPAAQPTTTPSIKSQSSTQAAPRAQSESKQRSIRHDGSLDCPTDFPIKGIERTRTAVSPSDAGYNATMPDICFETMSDAIDDGYRSISNLAAPRATTAVPQNEPEPSTTLVVRIRRWWIKRNPSGG